MGRHSSLGHWLEQSIVVVGEEGSIVVVVGMKIELEMEQKGLHTVAVFVFESEGKRMTGVGVRHKSLEGKCTQLIVAEGHYTGVKWLMLRNMGWNDVVVVAERMMEMCIMLVGNYKR